MSLIFFGGTWQKDDRQQAQIAAKEILIKVKIYKLHNRVSLTVQQEPRKLCDLQCQEL